MRLSESLRRGIIDSFVGGITNRFKIKERRITLFFEDILAEYIKECEENGYEKEMQEIGKEWGLLGTKILIPAPVKKLPLPLFTIIAKKLWTTLGILEDLRITKSDGTIKLSTNRDSITRIIGKNNFAVGCFAGILGVYLGYNVVPLEISQSTESSVYVYKITGKRMSIEGKSKEEYNRLNANTYINGYTLKSAIKNNMFQIKRNRIYFRGRSICNSENTLFHIIGNRNIQLNYVPELSYRYFDAIVNKDAPDEKKLLLLKMLLQTMGWGVVKIINAERSITLEISQLPCGLQTERENWNFLVMTVLGYLRIIDKRFKIKEVESQSTWLRGYFEVTN